MIHRILTRFSFKPRRCPMTIRGRYGAGRRSKFPLKASKGSFYVTLSTAGVATSCLVLACTTNDDYEFRINRQLLHLAGKALTTMTEESRIMTTKMDYLEHDSRDYDVYIKNPTSQDLPFLLDQFEVHGKEVWPWIWTHPNESGPHFVFVGVNADTLDRIRHLRTKSPSYNILLIASEESIRRAAKEAGDENIYDEMYCGIVSDAYLKLLNVEAKILMLSDERVIAFDSLTIT